MASRIEASELQTVGGYAIRDDGAGNLIIVGPTGATVATLSTSPPSPGTIPATVKSSVQSRTNQAPLAFSFTPPAIAGTYLLLGWLDVTTGTTITFKIIVGYTDPAAGAQTDNPVWFRQNNATAVQNPTANTADRFYFAMPLATDASATPITVTDNTGTYTTCAYRLNLVLIRLV